MKRINIKTSLLFWDIITFVVVFLSTYLMFEVVIKNIISNTSNSDFYEELDSIETDYFNALDYLENKDTLVYSEYLDRILSYSVESGKNKIKYDNSLIIISTDIAVIGNISGKKNDSSFTFDDNEFIQKEIKYNAAHIPREINSEDHKQLLNLSSNNSETEFINSLYTKDSDNKYILKKVPTIEDRDSYYRLTTGNNYRSDETISFKLKINNKDYIGITEYAKHGIQTADGSITHPIFIIADLESDFFYLINKVRNTFLLILGFVFLLVVIIKIITTTRITKEIAYIGQKISEESENIRTKGFVSKDVNHIDTGFIETSLLLDSYTDLHNRLNTLGEIVSGISDKELLSAVLMEHKSILDPHEEEMTVLFLDIKGFTTLTEKYQEKVFIIVNSIWVEVEKIIEQNNGKINKYIGDACLIIFQENKGSQNSSFYALKSAILILEKVKELQKTLEIDFNFRIGIDSGKVVYGKTGTDNNYELGVIGDTVNTAARLESINKQYQTNILITETVKDKMKPLLKSLNPQLSFYKVDKVRPKGKKEPKELYTILANNGKQSRFIGSEKYVSNKSLKYIKTIIENFTDDISLWKETLNAKSSSEYAKLHKKSKDRWVKTLKEIKKAYLIEPIPTMEKYISRIVTINEFEEYKTDRDRWLKKETHSIQEPSEDWIKYGFIEIEK